MKKRALLILLPFAMAVTGCSGSLKKSSIFNKKFLDMNAFFGMDGTTSNPDNLHFDEKYEFEGQKEEVLDLGTDVTPAPDGTYDDLLVLTKTDGSKGYFDLSTKKICVPVEKWKDAAITVEQVDDYGFVARFFEAVKVEDEKEVLYIYDEYGNKVYSGDNGAPSLQPIFVNELRDNVGARVQIYVDGITVGYATYAIDYSFIEAQTLDEFVEKHPYAQMGKSLERYGHPELVEIKVAETANETRYTVFNTKKEKYISTFAIPKQISGNRLLHFGDYYYYQIVNEVHEREKKYDFNEGLHKYNVETYSVNYLTGKVSTVKTDLLFKSFNASIRSLVDEKAVINYAYVTNAKYIEKDKTVNPVQHNLILGKNLDVKADVSGIPFPSLEKFGDNYIIDGTVYDSKLREVGYIANPGLKHRIVNVGGLYGLVDHTGKYLLEPINDSISVSSYSGEYYRVRKDDTTRYIKLNEKEEVVDIASFTNEEYLWSSDTSSEPYVIYQKVEDSKQYVFNELDGTFTPQLEPQTGDVVIVNCEYLSTMNYTMSTDALVFQRGSEYHAIYYTTHIINSLPEAFPRNK